jgi:hypothetical protein
MQIERIKKLEDIIRESEFEIKESNYYKIRNWILNNVPDYIDSYDDSISSGQYESKKWLLDELKSVKSYLSENAIMDWNQPTHVEVIGGWFGYPIIEMIQTIIDIKQIDFYEIDETCKKVLAQYVNHFEPEFKVAVFDDYFQREEIRRRQVIINTSSEHMEDIVKMKKYYKNYPQFPILAIQSNNYRELREHINCVSSVDELIEKNKINKIYFSGSIELPLYTRYMVIGQW